MTSGRVSVHRNPFKIRGRMVSLHLACPHALEAQRHRGPGRWPPALLSAHLPVYTAALALPLAPPLSSSEPPIHQHLWNQHSTRYRGVRANERCSSLWPLEVGEAHGIQRTGPTFGGCAGPLATWRGLWAPGGHAVWVWVADRTAVSA